MSDAGIWSLLPPLLAIALAMITRQVLPSLAVGVLGGAIVAQKGLLAGAIESLNIVVAVLGEAWQARVILFTLMMGSLLMVMQRSGGIEAFVLWAGRWPWGRSRRGAQLLAFALGLGIFIESTITCLVVGTVARPLFDRLRISREKLAYICDSTSAPVCMLIPINGWGAVILGLLSGQAAAGNLGAAAPLEIFLQAVFFNFYSWIAVGLVLLFCWIDRDFGPMAAAQKRARSGMILREGAQPVIDPTLTSTETRAGLKPSLSNMFLPLLLLLLSLPLGIVYTGHLGVAANGVLHPGWMDYFKAASGATAVFWAVIVALLGHAVVLLSRRQLRFGEWLDLTFRGASSVLPLAVIMALAFAIGMVCQRIGTGAYVARIVAPYLSGNWLAPAIFVVSAFIAFATGTSWGTFAIMIPLAVPLAAHFQAGGVEVSIPLVVSAVMGGGVFGDHCSPVSDTTVISSMAAACDHVDHVRTQMPYALLAGGTTLGIYVLWAACS